MMFLIWRCLAAIAAVLPAASSLVSTARTTLPSSSHCDVQDYVIIPDTPWIVYNMLYNSDQMVGTQCTNFGSVNTPATGNPSLIWSSVTDIDYIANT